LLKALCKRCLEYLTHRSTAAEVFTSTTVSHVPFTTSLEFSEAIRQALLQGSEPVLNIAAIPFYTGEARRKIDAVQEKQAISQEDYITSADVDVTNVSACDHAVVIGSGSMGGQSEAYSKSVLIIKDSSLSMPWAVDSIDVMVFPGAEVCGLRYHATPMDANVMHDLQNALSVFAVSWVQLPHQPVRNDA
jgi:hypothetical protein